MHYDKDLISDQKEAISKLRGHLIQHRRFSEILKQIEAAILFPPDSNLLFVVGPAGVGKTRLIHAIKKLVTLMIKTQALEDPGCIPYISVTAPVPEIGRSFPWNSLFHSYLDELKAPLPSSKLASPKHFDVDPRRGVEHAAINALKHRKPRVVLVDETNHFATSRNEKVLFDQTNRLKAFATQSGVLHICVGTYELERMAYLSGQLARRCTILHFNRYRLNSEVDRGCFKYAIEDIQKHIPLALELDLTTHAQFLHEGSAGCVGNLKNWLERALTVAYTESRSAICLEDLKLAAQSQRSRSIMESEAQEGEKALSNAGEQLELLSDGQLQFTTTDIPSNQNLDQIRSPHTPKSKRPKPGTPRPRRYPTGYHPGDPDEQIAV